MPSRPPSPLASTPSIWATSAGSVPLATCKMRPVVRSPTSAVAPSGSGASPNGALRQVAITAASVGAQGSVGACDPLGGGLTGADPCGVLGGVLDCGTGVVWSGIAARAVSDGWTVKVDASLEKSAQAVVTVSRAALSTAGSSRRRTREGTSFESNIDINGTALPVPADQLERTAPSGTRSAGRPA